MRLTKCFCRRFSYEAVRLLFFLHDQVAWYLADDLEDGRIGFIEVCTQQLVVGLAGASDRYLRSTHFLLAVYAEGANAMRGLPHAEERPLACPARERANGSGSGPN